ncbi:unnamed protein product, partial [Candidula unifasciata]
TTHSFTQLLHKFLSHVHQLLKEKKTWDQAVKELQKKKNIFRIYKSKLQKTWHTLAAQKQVALKNSFPLP